MLNYIFMDITVFSGWYYIDSNVFYNTHDDTWCKRKYWARFSTYESRTTQKLTICNYWGAIYTFVMNPHRVESVDQHWYSVYCCRCRCGLVLSSPNHSLNHWGRVMHIYVSTTGLHRFRHSLIAFTLPIYHLKQCWLVNRIFLSKSQWNLTKIKHISYKKMEFWPIGQFPCWAQAGSTWIIDEQFSS